jgi:peptide/nickel transport system substrate-binding protein
MAASSYSTNAWLLDPQFDSMFNDAVQTVNKEERFAKYGELQHYAVDLCPSIFLVDQLLRHPYQYSYVDWYADKEEPFSPVQGFDFEIRKIKVYPQKRAELLN